MSLTYSEHAINYGNIFCGIRKELSTTVQLQSSVSEFDANNYPRPKQNVMDFTHNSMEGVPIESKTSCFN